MRSGGVSAHLHSSVRKEVGIEKTEKLYTHTAKPVQANEVLMMLREREVHKDREVNGKYDIIKTKKRKHAYS